MSDDNDRSRFGQRVADAALRLLGAPHRFRKVAYSPEITYATFSATEFDAKYPKAGCWGGGEERSVHVVRMVPGCRCGEGMRWPPFYCEGCDKMTTWFSVPGWIPVCSATCVALARAKHFRLVARCEHRVACANRLQLPDPCVADVDQIPTCPACGVVRWVEPPGDAGVRE